MQKPKDKWTKGELSLKPGYQHLAKEIIKQWVRDGKPESDRPQIEIWRRVLKALNKE